MQVMTAATALERISSGQYGIRTQKARLTQARNPQNDISSLSVEFKDAMYLWKSGIRKPILPAIYNGGEALGVRQLAAAFGRIGYNEPKAAASCRTPKMSPL